MKRKQIDIVVISDVHLGTYGCHATELVSYLQSISPQILVLNGDIIDGWQFSKRYFPAAHMAVIKEILGFITNGTRVIYITGNHDEMLRRYTDLSMGSLILADKFLLEIDGKTIWIFHGDVFDNSTKGSAKILAKLGGKGYDLLILLNRFVNFVSKTFGGEKISFSKKVKNSVKKAIAFINNFENTVAEIAIEKKYDYVICGHIHQPEKRIIETDKGKVTYLNSGDWIENLSALEYSNKEWNIYYYNEKQQTVKILKEDMPALNVVSDEVNYYINSLIEYNETKGLKVENNFL
jgi:UDP-2,3-diacylglucosamine pyrophosphatase LpxH